MDTVRALREGMCSCRRPGVNSPGGGSRTLRRPVVEVFGGMRRDLQSMADATDIALPRGTNAVRRRNDDAFLPIAQPI